MSNDERIPSELYYDILRHVDPKDNETLFNALIASRHFSYEVERVLYRDLYLKGGNSNGSRRKIDLEQLLLVCHRVGGHVHTFTVGRVTTDSAMALQLRRVLQSTTNLDNLSLDFGDYSLIFGAIMPSPPPFQLSTFEVTYSLPQDFIPFLNSQHPLTYLDYRDNDNGQVFEGLAVPSLSRLCTCASGLLSVLFEQKVVKRICLAAARQLKFTNPPTDPMDHVETVAQMPLDAMTFWVPLFPKLRLLHIFAPKLEFKDIAEGIKSLHSLKHLQLVTVGDEDIPAISHFLPKLFNICSTLDTIDIIYMFGHDGWYTYPGNFDKDSNFSPGRDTMGHSSIQESLENLWMDF